MLICIILLFVAGKQRRPVAVQCTIATILLNSTHQHAVNVDTWVKYTDGDRWVASVQMFNTTYNLVCHLLHAPHSWRLLVCICYSLAKFIISQPIIPPSA